MADYLSLARLLQSGFWRARAGTFGECQTKTPPERAIWATRAGSRETSCVGDEGRCYEGAASQTHRRAEGSSRNVRHEQPIGHTLLEVPDHAGLGSWDRDRERLTCGRSKLNDVGPVVFRAEDHNAVLAGGGHPRPL